MSSTGSKRVGAEAVEAKGWLILFTHDVDPDASAHGCTPQELADTIADIQAAGIEIVTVAEGARRVRAAAGIQA